MHIKIEIIGDASPDADRLMKKLRDEIAYWGETKTELFSRSGQVETLSAELERANEEHTVVSGMPYIGDATEIAEKIEQFSSDFVTAPTKRFSL